MEDDKRHQVAEIQSCSSQSESEVIPNNRSTFDASETTSYSSSQLPKPKPRTKGILCKRRNPRVTVRRIRVNNVAAIGFPLGMSFAAVMAQVLYRRDAAADSMSPSHLSSICTSAINESLSSVFGDKLDGLTKNFEQSFDSTLSTLRLIYESTISNEGNKLNNMRLEIPNSKLNTGDCSGNIVMEDCQSEPLSHEHAENIDQSISSEEFRDDFHMESVTHDLALHGQSNQMVCFSPTSSGAVVNNPVISSFEKSVVEQCRSNDLKTVEIGLTRQKLKLKEIDLALRYDLNDLERSKLAMEVSKSSFKTEKFKSQLEDTRYGELNKKCIDCLIAGLFIMSASLFYGAYVYNFEQFIEAAELCAPEEESYSWFTPKSVAWFNSSVHVFICRVGVVSRMVFGFLMIIVVAYLLFQRASTLSSQTMPVTFILLMLCIGCGYCGKLCIDTLGGSGNVWLLYWEILCLLHFASICWTSALYRILHGPIDVMQTKKGNTIFRYWIRRLLFYVILLVVLPLCCGLMPFASLAQWKDHFMSKVITGSEW
ncbi:protein CPR-5 isoform X3 [Lathyrus oleraceus]|uniref:protein CPR-5 isoform X3 n=1 Tax=Pisum sativum TaxID=3888 RepID=UPI0021D22400|nr:protein CPR-5 isoform X3 [Pisum sativum]